VVVKVDVDIDGPVVVKSSGKLMTEMVAKWQVAGHF
jgi:hypothetical protein